MSTIRSYNHHLFWLIFKKAKKHTVFPGFLHQKPTFVDSFTKMDAVSRFPASRAWFPGQGSISSLQSSDRSAGQPRWCQMLPDAVRCPQMLPDAAGGSQMPPDAASSYAVRCLQMLSGASRCCQMIPDVTDDLKCCQMLPAQMPQDARCWLMLPIPTPIPTPMPTQTLIQMPTPTTIPTPIPIQISTYNQEQYPYRFRVLPKGNFKYLLFNSLYLWLTVSVYYLLIFLSMRMPMPQLVHTSTNVAFSACASHFMYAYGNACVVHPNGVFCCLLAFSSCLDAWNRCLINLNCCSVIYRL